MDTKSLALLVIFSLMLLSEASDLTQAQALLHHLPSRKMMEKEKNTGLGLNEELRTVPSGPDPLHHHVNPPTQPRNHFHQP